MFEEGNKENFVGWTSQLIEGGLKNMTCIPQFEWKSTLPNSNFDLLKRLQQCLQLTDQLVISGLCYMKKAANRGLRITDRSFYKLAVICIFIAQKFYSDFHYEIEDFSITSGITINDILKLQTITLELLDYNLILTQRDYFAVKLFRKL